MVGVTPIIVMIADQKKTVSSFDYRLRQKACMRASQEKDALFQVLGQSKGFIASIQGLQAT